MKRFLLSFLCFTSLILPIFTKTAEEWKSRTIYQLLTDRFAKSNGEDVASCQDLGTYCGGTFKGIEKNLDYIQGMGFNAIWISPVQPNAPNGYHGFWIRDFYGINPHFGTEQDLKDLIKACHDRDIWVMIDIVINHVGFVQPLDKAHEVENNDYSQVVPFNDPSHYHKFEIECHDAERTMPGNLDVLQTCWLFHLPDLNQSHPFVRQATLEWVKWFVNTYEIDGLRLDALRHVSKEFWKEFSQAAGVYTLGEAWEPIIKFSAQFQESVDATLNFPLAETILAAFAHGKPMTAIDEYYREAFPTFRDITVLANFVDCHDKARMLSHSNDVAAFKAATAFTICSVGIPTVYYGSEQGLTGGEDPLNRESLWGLMKTDSDLYTFLKTLNEFRKNTGFYKLEQVQRVADEHIYAFTRGEYFFGFTNSAETQAREVTNHPYEDGTWLCNAFNNDDCILVQNGKFTLAIANKDTKILFPMKDRDSAGLGSKVREGVQRMLKGLTISEQSSVGI